MEMRTLYISDLDGTLLNGNKEVSEYTVNALNELICKGVHFSVATARTAASVVKILSGININIPVVLMNGVVVYDIQNRKYIKIESIPVETVKNIVYVFNKHSLKGFMYSITGDNLITYYEALNTKALKDFYDERVMKYYKSFEKVDSFLDKVSEGRVIYFALIDKYERLSLVFNSLKKHPDIDMAFYKDIYEGDQWYLEIHSNNASKYNAVKYLCSYCKFDRVIGFGDNLNDIPLFKACDEGYAVSNAVKELMEKATGIIGDNNSDSVARYIYERELK